MVSAMRMLGGRERRGKIGGMTNRIHRLARLPMAARLSAAMIAALTLVSCSTTGGSVPGQISDAAMPANGPGQPVPAASNATDARAYRRDAASHVYSLNRQRIYPGMLPPVLYAVGTLQVELRADGGVAAMKWLRAPSHAPEAIAEIERTVLAAAPFPVATRLGPVTWTDTWLWDKSARFQLDTLTEGQAQQ